MAEKRACSANIFAGFFSNTADCSDACKSKATMFAFGRDNQACDSNGNCRCFCHIRAAPNGTCVQKYSPHYNLYRYIDSVGKSDTDEVRVS